MRKITAILTIYFFTLLFPASLSAQKISDLIQPVKLKSGEEKSLVISDLFYSTDYNLRFADNKYVKIIYHPEVKKLTLNPDSSFTGVTVINFSLNENKYSIPVFCEKESKVTFKFTPNKKYKQLSVFGSFNDWNRHQYFMEPNNNGLYSVTVPIEPGNYQYKFYADGLELTDPLNPDSVSNGMGSYNSVLTVADNDTTREFLAQLGLTRKESNVSLNFYFDSQLGIVPDSNNAFAFIENSDVSSRLKFNNKRLILTLPQRELSGLKRIRLVVDYGSGISNMQTVFLYNGAPLKPQDKIFNWHESIIYSLLIDRFYDGDKSNSIPIVHDSLSYKANYMGGDFVGIIKKLQDGYFDSLGVNTIWISPVYDNPDKAYREYPKPHRWFTGYHGYWPVNSFATDEHFGTISQLKLLVKTAHKHGIKILLDFVSHHVHEDNPIFKEHRDWFGSLYLPDGSLNIRQWDTHRLTTWFEPYLPSFDFIHSDAAVSFMTNNALWWLRITGADGFRHDAVKHVPNKFWRKLTSELKSSGLGNLYQIGETFGSYKLVSSYVNNGQLDAQFNFNLYNVAQAVFIDSNESFISLNNELKKSFSIYGVNNLMGNIMDSHDKNRYMAYADGDIKLSQWDATEIGWDNPPKVDHPSSYNKAELYYAYMLSTPGIPVVYYGSEFGMTGASDPDNRRMMRFGNALNKYEKRMLKKVSRIIKLRRNNSALNFGDFLSLLVTHNVYAYLRSDMNERVLIVLNKSSDKKENVEIKFPAYIKLNKLHDLMSGENIRVKNNKVLLTSKPLESKFYLLK